MKLGCWPRRRCHVFCSPFSTGSHFCSAEWYILTIFIKELKRNFSVNLISNRTNDLGDVIFTCCFFSILALVAILFFGAEPS